MIHIVFCVIYCVFYLIHGVFFLFDIVNADMLSLITMMATCGLILNEMTKNHKKTKSVLSRFLPIINGVLGIIYMVGMLVFTVMYFVNNGVFLEWQKWITILPIVVTVIFSIMNITKRKENQNKEKIITCCSCRCRRFIAVSLRRRRKCTADHSNYH